ncbi:MAG TPA: alpha/beta hydrolase [Candidatus Binatia bacterium]|nr:alpha/beta hydrolase [Candidatus Binatia bacterium]
MPLDEIAPLLDLIRGAPVPGSIAELRATLPAFATILNDGLPDVARFDPAVPVAPGVTADVLVPSGTPPFPTLVYLHGGGWSICSPATHAKLTRQLCLGARAVVVSVDYRLAPEHPFPVPYEDCLAAARWTREHAARFGGDGSRLAIGGDSAGANLAAAVIEALGPALGVRAALLFYGAFDVAASRRDYRRWSPVDDPILPESTMHRMLEAYVSGGAALDDPRLSPLFGDVGAFPPACLVVGTADPLYGESLAMHEKLRAAGRRAELHRFADMPHAFVQLPGLTEAAEAVRVASAFLRRELG